MRYQSYNSLRGSPKRNRSMEQSKMKATLHTTGGMSEWLYERILVSTSITRLSYLHSPALYYI